MLLCGIVQAYVDGVIVQAYVDGVNSKIFCLFGFVWTRCVLLLLQFYGIYFDDISGVVL